MRLVVWNARRGSFIVKYPLLAHLKADIAVIPEIAAPVESSPHVLWVGVTPKQGMAIVAAPPYSVKYLDPLPDVPKYIVPIAVTGPQSFVLLAVWTLGEKPFPYVEAAAKAIEMYGNIFSSSPVVMMGDFNSNAIWDRQHPPSSNHSAVVAKLKRHRLVSAYHDFFDIKHGAEIHPTFYLYGHESRPYHIDYCFVPQSWTERIEKVGVENYLDWKQYSDHRPLIVDIRDDNSTIVSVPEQLPT